MHSRIFQVSLEPIERDEYLSESEFFEHWFTSEIADYVIDSENKDNDIEWLSSVTMSNGITIEKDDDGYYLIVTSKHEYFDGKYNRFLRELKRLENITIDDFINKTSYLFDLNGSYNNKYGFYIYIDGEMFTLDNFVRLYATNVKYYIGATLDYHC